MKTTLLIMLLMLVPLMATATDWPSQIVTITISDISVMNIVTECVGGGSGCDGYDAATDMVIMVRPISLGWRADVPYPSDWMDWQSITQRDHIKYDAPVDLGGSGLLYNYVGNIDPSQMPAPMSVRYRFKLAGETSPWFITQVAQPAYDPGSGVTMTAFCLLVPDQVCVVSFTGDIGAYQVKLEYLTNSSGWQTPLPTSGEDFSTMSSPPIWAIQLNGNCDVYFPDAEGSTRLTFKDTAGNIGGPFAGPAMPSGCGI